MKKRTDDEIFKEMKQKYFDLMQRYNKTGK